MCVQRRYPCYWDLPAENYVCDVYSVLDLHVRLHVHEVLTGLAHHLRLSLGLRMRVRGMCHHGHLARMTGLWCVAWVSV
jgi:hypothetical protein